ncbi:GNAT family N-acetyltransferase [Psychroflexus gondwanensis]|uniref:GNAT family N-acetyltransferase n=1 Tax=Psychroflexus gondwanensis TaxID=251 RepID=UPI0011BE3EC0|nr:GNAT family N-acetyltransferase [Psychroflexus gondwanensis]TXE19182.1 GNAT family N-acetyltransferase [Psychroflexus gondwanensis]
MSFYKVLNKQVFSLGEYSIVPIRMEDRYDIMQWRNEQMYHLRQAEPLTKSKQNAYFENVVAKLFEQEQPNQLLFSFLKGEECIGYGGLVHINWVDKNAEVSFVMDTKLETEGFVKHWTIYLSLIEQVAFEQLNFHKINGYAFDLRPRLYDALDSSGFCEEAILKEHCLFENKFIDVIIYSKFNTMIKIQGDRIYLKEINVEDITDFVMSWFEDKELMKYYTNSKNKITEESLLQSIKTGKQDGNLFTFGIFVNDTNNLIGTIKLGPINFTHKTSDLVALIGDKNYRGKGLSVDAISLGNQLAFEEFGLRKLHGGMYLSNIPSIKVYTRAGWIIEGRLKGFYANEGKNEDRILVGCFNPEYFNTKELEELKNNEKRYYDFK